MEGSGLGIRDVVGLSVKVMVVAGRAACGAVLFFAAFLTTMFLFSVSLWLSRIPPRPSSNPFSKSSSSSAGFGFGDTALGLWVGEKTRRAAVGGLGDDLGDLGDLGDVGDSGDLGDLGDLGDFGDLGSPGDAGGSLKGKEVGGGADVGCSRIWAGGRSESSVADVVGVADAF